MIFIIGAYGGKNHKLDGQTVKTQNIHKLLEDKAEERVVGFDTMRLYDNPLLLFKMIWNMIKCDTLVIIPCKNNLTYIFPVAFLLSKLCGFRIIHICIGGFQISYFLGINGEKPHKLQCYLSKHIHALLPEMRIIEKDLTEKLHFRNVCYFPNFRFLDTSHTNSHNEDRLSLVFLARIMKKKGYKTVFNFAEYALRNNLNISISFYGDIIEEDREDFMEEIRTHSENVVYGGLLQQDQILSTLLDCDVMLFPTQYYEEGLPGTIIDAYLAGLPVVATRWKYASEFIKDGETGFVVSFDEPQQEFNERITALYNDRLLLAEMKKNAKNAVYNYSHEYAWQILSKYLN